MKQRPAKVDMVRRSVAAVLAVCMLLVFSFAGGMKGGPAFAAEDPVQKQDMPQMQAAEDEAAPAENEENEEDDEQDPAGEQRGAEQPGNAAENEAQTPGTGQEDAQDPAGEQQPSEETLPEGILNTDEPHFEVRAAEDTDLQESGETLPAAYDARGERWYRGIGIRNQGYTGLCWAIAAADAARISWAKQNGSSSALSPVHLGYFTYHRTNDPLGNTGGDRNTILAGEDYDMIGGDLRYTLQVMANQAGFAPESLVPLEDAGEEIPQSREWYETVVMRNGEVLETEDDIKRAILEHGSAVVSHEAAYALENRVTYKGRQTCAVSTPADDTERAPDHSVVLVGWDDGFSASLFRSSARPSRDGAWIVRDAEGTMWRDHGYYYLSYDDKLYDAISIDARDAGEYDSCYQLDGNAWDSMVQMRAGGKAANFFSVAKDSDRMILTEAGFSTWNDYRQASLYDDRTYTVEVYTDVSGPKDLDDAHLAAKTQLTAVKPGFHTVSLPQKIRVAPGSVFAVAVTSESGRTLLGAEKSHVYDDLLEFTGEVKAGQSYLYDPSSGAWKDLAKTSDPGCARIKAFAVDADHDISDAKVTLEYEKIEWTGEAMEPEVTVRFNGRILTPDRDYTVAYSDNVDAGTATAHISGAGKYTGSQDMAFEILEQEGEEDPEEEPSESGSAELKTGGTASDSPDTSDGSDPASAGLLMLASLTAGLLLLMRRRV